MDLVGKGKGKAMKKLRNPSKWLPTCGLGAFIILMSIMAFASPSRAEPGEVAQRFFESLVRGDARSATLIVTSSDQEWPEALGRYRAWLSSRPIFPSLWNVSVASAQVDGDNARIEIRISHPEIEELISRTRSAAFVTPEFLSAYLERDVPMSELHLTVEMVREAAEEWRVFTNAAQIAWQSAIAYPPRVNFSPLNTTEILEFRASLLDRFPNRNNEVEQLTRPLVASTLAAEGVSFSDIAIAAESPRWQEGVYDVRFTVENRSEYVVEYLKVAIIVRNDAGQIIERDDLQVFYSGSLPQGLLPEEQLVESSGLRAQNLGETPVTAEIAIIDLRAR